MGLTLSKEEKETLYYSTYDLIRIVKTLKANESINLKEGPEIFNTSKKTANNTSNYYSKYVLRYTTFISANGAGVSDIVRFGGDRDYFSWNSSLYRTRSDVSIDYNAGSQTIVKGDFDTNPTKWYLNGVYQGSRQASTNGMKFIDARPGTSSSFVSFSHSVGIPYADSITPNIDYQYQGRVSGDGRFSITGDRDGMPNHEFYIFVENSHQVLELFTAEQQTIMSLYPPMEHSFNVSY